MCRAGRNPAFPWEDVFEVGLYDPPAALVSEKRGRETFYEQLTSLFLSVGTYVTSNINGEGTETIWALTATSEKPNDGPWSLTIPIEAIDRLCFPSYFWCYRSKAPHLLVRETDFGFFSRSVC